MERGSTSILDLKQALGVEKLYPRGYSLLWGNEFWVDLARIHRERLPEPKLERDREPEQEPEPERKRDDADGDLNKCRKRIARGLSVLGVPKNGHEVAIQKLLEVLDRTFPHLPTIRRFYVNERPRKTTELYPIWKECYLVWQELVDNLFEKPRDTAEQFFQNFQELMALVELMKPSPLREQIVENYHKFLQMYARFLEELVDDDDSDDEDDDDDDENSDDEDDDDDDDDDSEDEDDDELRLIPATKSSIESLEKVMPAGESASFSCPICLEDFGIDVITRMPCSHQYHQHCIEHWLKIHHRCPVCRLSMPVEQ